MSTNNFKRLSMATVQQALSSYGFEYIPVGTSQFEFTSDGTEYYLYCANLPRLFLERNLDATDYLGKDATFADIFSALNAVNDKYHLVKASRMSDNTLVFTLCLREDRYLEFKDRLPEYIQELDDAIESFRMACDILRMDDQRAKESSLQSLIDRMLNADDDMYKAERAKS